MSAASGSRKMRISWLVAIRSYGVVALLCVVIHCLTASLEWSVLGVFRWCWFCLLILLEGYLYYNAYLKSKYDLQRWWDTTRVLGAPGPQTRQALHDLNELS